MTEPVLFAKKSPFVPLYEKGKVSPCFTERESGTPRIEKGFSGMMLLLSARKSPLVPVYERGKVSPCFYEKENGTPPFRKGGLGGFPRL